MYIVYFWKLELTKGKLTKEHYALGPYQERVTAETVSLIYADYSPHIIQLNKEVKK